MVKLQQIGESQYSLTIPNQIRKAKGWEKGDEILVEVNDQGNIELRKKKQ